MILNDATPEQIDSVLDGTHPLWSDGLDPRAYRAYVRSLLESAWGRAGGYRFLALCDAAGEVVSAMKLYRFRARTGGVDGGKTITLGGVGAVFTPPRHRRRGHAARLLEMAHEEMRNRGDAASLLHSEIGEAYYARLGYRRLEPDAALIRVPVRAGHEVSRSGAGASLRRLGPNDDLAPLRRLREVEDGRVPFALARDAAYWDYLRARAEIPSTHLGENRWESRLVLHEHHGEVQGYLWSLLREPPAGPAHDGGEAARLIEFAEAAPGASLPLLLEDLFEACRRRGIGRVEAWQAGELARRAPRAMEGSAQQRPESLPVVPMWKPLREDAEAGLAAALASAPQLLSDVF